MLHLKAFINVTQSCSSEVLSAECTTIQLPHGEEQALLTLHFIQLPLFPFFPYTLKCSATLSLPDATSPPQWLECSRTAQMWPPLPTFCFQTVPPKIEGLASIRLQALSFKDHYPFTFTS